MITSNRCQTNNFVFVSQAADQSCPLGLQQSDGPRSMHLATSTPVKEHSCVRRPRAGAAAAPGGVSLLHLLVLLVLVVCSAPPPVSGAQEVRHCQSCPQTLPVSLICSNHASGKLLTQCWAFLAGSEVTAGGAAAMVCQASQARAVGLTTEQQQQQQRRDTSLVASSCPCTTCQHAGWQQQHAQAEACCWCRQAADSRKLPAKQPTCRQQHQ